MVTQHAPAPDPTLQTLRAILELPEQQIDLAHAKLTIDQMIDPAIDIAATLKQLDTMAAEVNAQVAGGTRLQARINSTP